VGDAAKSKVDAGWERCTRLVGARWWTMEFPIRQETVLIILKRRNLNWVIQKNNNATSTILR
jgi:hypothetical protein